MSVLLEVREATKQYAGIVAIQNISFDVHPGEIIGLIGPNGAGKTTLVNMITGVTIPTRGTIHFQGRLLNGMRPHTISHQGIARTFQVVRPFANLTVWENVAVGAMFGAGGVHRSTRDSFQKAEKILTLLQFADRKNDPADSLTIGGRKRLELAKALAQDPKLLLLDEVMAGLRGAEINDAIELIREINRMGITILVIEHVMKVIMSVCQRVVVLDYGKKIAEGTPAEIIQNPAVIQAYLGRSNSRKVEDQ